MPSTSGPSPTYPATRRPRKPANDHEKRPPGHQLCGRRGTRALKALAQWQHDHDHVTRSQLEREFLRFLTEDGFPPPPRVNELLHGFEADFHWPDHRLVVETDGLRCHTTPHAFHRDRKRDRVHRSKGLRVERITWHDVTRDRPALRREARAWFRKPECS